MVSVPGGRPDADLSKAQLLFWTVITITIFIIKSAEAGQLWNVPPQLVTLMGISQAGFLTRKQFLVYHERKQTKEKEAEKRKTKEKKSESKKLKKNSQ